MLNRQQRAWLSDVLGVALPTPEGEDTGARLKDLAVQASVLPEPGRSELLARVRKLGAAAEEGAIAALAEDIAKAAQAARVAEARQQAGNTVTFRVLQKQWIGAEARAQALLGSFLDSLLGDPELQADQRYPQLQAEAGRLEALFPDDGGRLTAALGVLDDADDAGRPKAQKAAMAALEAYRKDLESEQDLQGLQEVADEFYDGASFFSELQSTLAELGKELARRA